MKKSLPFLLTLCVLLSSCAKLGRTSEISAEDNMYLSFVGVLDDMQVPTKALLQNTVKPVWKGSTPEKPELVYVFDGFECLGSLETSLFNNSSNAVRMSGTVKKPSQDAFVLSFVYCSSASGVPALSEDKISFKFDRQAEDAEAGKDMVPFVAYASMSIPMQEDDGQNPEGGKDFNYESVNFHIATSLITINCVGLEPETDVDGISLNNVSTDCVLSIDPYSAPKVSASSVGTIFKTLVEGSKSNSEGEMALTLALPYQGTSSEARCLSITQGDNTYDDDRFPMGVFAKGELYNEICQMTENEYDFNFALAEDSYKVFSNTEDSETKFVPVDSKKTRKESADITLDACWYIKSYQIGSQEPVTVNGTSFEANGIKAVANSDALEMTASSREFVAPGNHIYWANTNGRTDNLLWTPENWSGRPTVDLSKFNPQNETFDNPMNTANCYIIRHAGTYMLPLVYGNAVREGVINTASFSPELYRGSGLTNFENHLGNGISSAFIENNEGCKACECSIVWQDEAPVINGLEIIGEEQDVYNTGNVRYLKFVVDETKVCQNNAVIAIKDANGDIIWSWHIWTTNNPALLSAAIPVFNYDNEENDFHPLNAIGWIDSKIYEEREDMMIIIEQTITGNTATVFVSQPELSDASTQTLYQFGRKDPMPSKSNLAEGTIETNKSTVSLSYAIKNPSTKVTDSALWSTQYYNLWTGRMAISYANWSKTIMGKSVYMIKTVYDPSPAGYMVPNPLAFTGFTAFNPWSADVNNRTITDLAKFNVKGDFVNGWHFYTKLTPEHKVNVGGECIFFPATGSTVRYITSYLLTDATVFHLSASRTSINAVYHSAWYSNMGDAYSLRPILEYPMSSTKQGSLPKYYGSEL